MLRVEPFVRFLLERTVVLDLIERVDAFLIDKVFQPFVGWIAENLPFNCFQQARLCTSLCALMWIFSQAGDVAAAVRSGSATLQTLHGTLLLVGLGAILVLHAVFPRAGGNVGHENRLRGQLYIHRLTILFSFAVNAIKAAIGLGSLPLFAVATLATAAVYVGSCSTPPPKRQEHLGTERGWKLSFLAG